MFRGMPVIHNGPDSQGEITQSDVSMWKSLRFILLVEPPAAPTSRAGPAYQDLTGRQQRPLKNSQQSGLASQGLNPSA